MYCNSCISTINKDDVVFCSQCNVPLHKECANHCLECNVELCDNCYGNNAYKCERCYKPNDEFHTIRRSHLELYNSCPYALYLELVKKVPVPMGKHAELGIMIHQILDLLSNDMLSTDEAIAKFTDEFEATFTELEPGEEEKFYNTGLICINRFSQIKDMFGDKFETEKNIIFTLEDNLPKVSCTLDRVDFVGDDIHISDWKTGKPMSGQKLITDLQAPLYIEAINKEYGTYPSTFTLYYLTHDKIKKYELQPDGNYKVKSGRTEYTLDIQNALNRTVDILKKINNKNFSMPKDVSMWYCSNMCSHYKTGVCSSSNKEQWKVLNNKYSEDK